MGTEQILRTGFYFICLVSSRLVCLTKKRPDDFIPLSYLKVLTLLTYCTRTLSCQP